MKAGWEKRASFARNSFLKMMALALTKSLYRIVILREKEVKLPCMVSLGSAALLLASSSVEKISEEA
jgi:hypothetical protein